MSQTYDYNKTPVNVPRLKLEILADETIVKTLEGIAFNVGETPNNLHITFNEALASGEETALDSVVSSHDGTSLTIYIRICQQCGNHIAESGLAAPTACPICSCEDLILISEVADHSLIDIGAFTAKTDPHADDILMMEDSEDSDKKKKLKISNLHVPWILDAFQTSGVLFPNNDTGYCHIGGAGAITNTEALAQIQMPKGRAIAIQGYCSAGSGTFTLRKNGADTAITGLIDEAGQFRIFDSVEFADGDLLSLYYDSGVGWTVYGIQGEFESEVI